MNDQQVWGLLAACALLMIPFGAMLGTTWRTARAWLQRVLPPRHLKRVGERRRASGKREQA
ncbi:cellulose biosynthesis protein BcsF [Thermomonas sp. LB-4]|uniref:cellulose biosynthesis protein BcsF n=1 Tax=Thermomonas sp. LB-4 TaxID=3102790 RepID=UPI002EDB6CC2